MNKKQIMAVRCAYADLVGAMQAYEQGDMHTHDWDAHAQSIDDMEQAFDFLTDEGESK